jgi:hypothetical protein
MAAIPIRSEDPKTCILELCNTAYPLDPYSDRLTSQGYEVVSANNYDDALKLAHQCNPALVVVYDDPDGKVDAIRWLEMQHSDGVADLAMTRCSRAAPGRYAQPAYPCREASAEGLAGRVGASGRA